MSEPKIVILGCGFAGAAVALFLKHRGISSTIYEIRSKEYTHGGNIALAPNALRVLDHLFLYDRIRGQGFNYSELRFDNSEGVCLGKFLNGSKPLYNYEAIRIRRTIVRDELRKQLDAEGIEVRWSKECEKISEGDSKVVLKFKDGEYVEADFLIGTDGIHSKVREYFAPDAHPTFSGLMGVMGHADRCELPQNAFDSLSPPCFLFGASGSFAIMPSSFDGNEIGYFATLESNDLGRNGWSDLEHNKVELQRMLVDRFLDAKTCSWNEVVKDLVKKTPQETLSSWPFFSVPALADWFSPSGRVICIGDSAHAIPPTGGQGAAMAFEDAESLVHTISYILSPHFDNSKLIDTLIAWQDHRKDRISKVHDFTSKNGNLRKSTPHRYEQAAKEWLIWAMFKWMGEEGGAHWLYSYNAESVRAVFP